MLNLITASATYLFPCGRALKLVKNGINVTNSTNPLILTKKYYFGRCRLLYASSVKISSALRSSWVIGSSFNCKSKSGDYRFSHSCCYRNLWKLLKKRTVFWRQKTVRFFKKTDRFLTPYNFIIFSFKSSNRLIISLI